MCLAGCGKVLIEQDRPIEIEVSLSGNGSGSVRTPDGSIDCKPTCKTESRSGRTLTLIAAPDASSMLASWSLPGCVGLSCTVTPTDDLLVEVTFEKKKHTVTIERMGDGSVTSDRIGIDCGTECSAAYDDGTSLTLTATPLGAASFGGWSGDCAGLDPACTLIIDGDKRATASFDLQDRTLSVAIAGTGAGTVAADLGVIACPPDCIDTYPAGSAVTLTATPDARSVFAGWSLTECADLGPCRVVLTAARAVTATFEERRYSLEVRAQGPGSAAIASIPAGIDCGPTCTADFPSGTSIQLTASPNAGSRFARWSDACSGVNPTCRITLTADALATADLERVPLLAAGGSHNCALRPNGELRCWGYNGYGQLGLGTTDNLGDNELPSTAPPVDVPTNIRQVCAGGHFTCILLETGQVRCWGFNFDGQLGLNHNENIGDENSDLPIASNVVLNAAAEQIACGAAHACARISDGSIRCWGAGSSGQLGHNCRSNIGDGVAGNCATLNDDVPVGGMVARIVAGGESTCAVMATGTLRCWGRNNYGQLGYGHANNLGDDPNEMPTNDLVIPQGIADVRMGAFHTCVLASSGEAFCWGRADRGQLGNGSSAGLDTPPTAPVRLGGAVVMSLGSFEDHNCVSLAGGTFRCWGYAVSGQIGYGTTEALGEDPTDFVTTDLPLMNVVLPAPGGSHSCALLSNDDIHCWGRGQEGQLGYGNMNSIGATPGSLAGSAGPVF